MYDKFYQFRSDPFRLSPDHAFCYRHPSYAKGRAYMEYALDAAEGFVVVTGMPGMGKTTLINDLLANSSLSKYLAASIVTTRLDADDLLRSIAYEFSLNVQDADKATIIQKLKRLFVLSTRNARPPLLIVDEAQNLTLGALEELRLLTNMQYEGLPLLQIFLLGQDELREKLLDPKLEQLRQRISAATQLEPLTEEHTGSYIVHRLRVVGWNNRPRISLGAVSVLHQTCQGVPRRINQFCSRLFLLGAAEERDRLTTADARQVALELADEGLTPPAAELPPDDPPSDDTADLGEELFRDPEPVEAPKSTDRLDPGISDIGELSLSDKQLGLGEPESLGSRKSASRPSIENPSRVETAQWALQDPAGLSGTEENGRGSGSASDRPPEIAAFLRESAANDNQASPSSRPSHAAYTRRPPLDEFPDDDDFYDDDDPPERGSTIVRWILVLLLLGGGVLLFLDWRTELKAWFAEHSVDVMTQLQSIRGSADVADRRPDRPLVGAGDLDRADPVSNPRPKASGFSDPTGRDQPSAPALRGDTDVVTTPGVAGDRTASLSRANPTDEPAAARVIGRDSIDSPDRAEDIRAISRVPAQAAEAQSTRPREGSRVSERLPLVVEEVVFAFDSTRLDGGAILMLDRVVGNLRRGDSDRVLLVGHADNTGPAAYNRQLSTQRARAVAEYLQDQGIESRRLKIVDPGDTGPFEDQIPVPESKRSVQVVIVGRR